MTSEKPDVPEELTAPERARLRRRDRKRYTQMVVDNAGVKRTTLALAQRRATLSKTPGPAREKPPG